MRKLRTIEMNRLTLEEFKEAEKLPLIVVLDDVRSLYNVGSVFRSCDAFRVEAVYPPPLPMPRFIKRHWVAKTAWIGNTSRLPKRR